MRLSTGRAQAHLAGIEPHAVVLDLHHHGRLTDLSPQPDQTINTVGVGMCPAAASTLSANS